MFVETEKRPAGDFPLSREQHSELDEASKLLLKTAALLEGVGLAKNTTCDEGGRMCVRGALLQAEGVKKVNRGFGLSLYWDQAGHVAKEADARLGKALGKVSALWNNEPDRTLGEVVAKLRAVALTGK